MWIATLLLHCLAFYVRASMALARAVKAICFEHLSHRALEVSDRLLNLSSPFRLLVESLEEIIVVVARHFLT